MTESSPRRGRSPVPPSVSAEGKCRQISQGSPSLPLPPLESVSDPELAVAVASRFSFSSFSLSSFWIRLEVLEGLLFTGPCLPARPSGVGVRCTATGAPPAASPSPSPRSC